MKQLSYRPHRFFAPDHPAGNPANPGIRARLSGCRGISGGTGDVPRQFDWPLIGWRLVRIRTSQRVSANKGRSGSVEVLEDNTETVLAAYAHASGWINML
jgi:hypothetical protein